MDKPLVVVIVDDEESVTKTMRRALEEQGWEIHTASQGREGIESVLELNPDVVFVDVRMPVVQGYDVCRTIKKGADTRDSKVVIMSGLMTNADRAWAMNCGADETLQKPFGRDEIVRMVKELTGKKN
jgi:DNA-binding response OmpR family regulator